MKTVPKRRSGRGSRRGRERDAEVERVAEQCDGRTRAAGQGRRRLAAARSAGRRSSRQARIGTSAVPSTRRVASRERTESTRLVEVVTRLRNRASSTTGVVIASFNDPSRIERAIRTTTGNPRNSSMMPATGGRSHLRIWRRPAPRPGRTAPRACDPCRSAGVGAGCHGGGRKPNEDTTSCPSGPISQPRKAAAASWFGDAPTTTPA